MGRKETVITVLIGKKWYWVDATLGDWLSRELYEDRTVLEIW